MFRCCLVLSCFLLSSGELVACKCLPPPPPSQALSEAAVVFSGVVKSVDPAGEGKVMITFTVSKAWKGVGEEKTVKLIAYGTSCDWRFQVDTAYLLYCNRSDGKLSTHLCTRTRLLEGAEDEIKALDAASAKED